MKGHVIDAWWIAAIHGNTAGVRVGQAVPDSWFSTSHELSQAQPDVLKCRLISNRDILRLFAHHEHPVLEFAFLAVILDC